MCIFRPLVALALLVLSACLATPSARADGDQGIGVRYEVLADPTRALTLDDLRDAAFQPVLTTFGGGLATPDYWLRITFTDADPPPLTLRLRPRAIDRIQLFTPLPDGRFGLSQTGDSATATDDAPVGLEWRGFRLDPLPGQGPFYIRISTQTVTAITVSTVTRQNEQRADITSASWAALMLGLHLLAIALVIVRLDPLGSPAVLLFLLLITSSAFYRFWSAGYGPLAFGVDATALSETVEHLLASVSVLLLVAFHHELLRGYDPPRPMHQISFGLLVLSVAGFAAGLLGHAHLSLSIALACYALLIPTLLLLAITLRKDGAIPLRHLRFVYAGYGMVLVANMVVRLGLFDSDFVYRHSAEFLSVIGATMLLALLALQDQSARQALLQREMALAEVATGLRIAKDFHADQLDLIRRIDSHARQVFVETSAALNKGEFRSAGPKADRSITSLRAVIDRGLLAHQSVGDTWQVQPAAFDPGETLRGIAATLAPAEAWRFDIPPCEIVSDRDLFSLAARNLLSNALRYGTAGQPVTIRLRPDRHGPKPVVSITVINACPTPYPFDIDRVFDKFYRGRSSRGKDGTGLGLFIARDAVTALGGQITIGATRDGKCITASIRVPSQCP